MGEPKPRGLQYREQQVRAAETELSAARREARGAGTPLTGVGANRQQLERAKRAQQRQRDYARSVGYRLADKD